MEKLPAWSYSSIKTFEQCPRKYYHLKVVKDVVEDKSVTTYGSELHTACEEYVRDGKPLPGQFSFVKSALDNLKNRPGKILCEYKMGLTEDLQPCDFFAPNVWWRGVIDLLILDGEIARIVDYKTSKNTKYADTGQLELMALAVFKHFPDIRKVKAGLLFVVAKEFPKANYSVDDQPRLWEKWLSEYKRMEVAYKRDVWNAKPSGLCKKHCPVLSCSHNGRA
jgi:CRISPR/Cas system-associated exonuclease Cas4 (RecB family)